MIEYKTIPGVQGTYFDCPHKLGTLSVTSCGASWKASMTRDAIRDGRRVTCRCCSVGEAHAMGATAPSDDGAAPSGSGLLGSRSCARCGRHNGRLVRGAICISCYNREREWIKGRNGKGTAPKFLRPVFPAAVAAIYADEGDRRRKIHYRLIGQVADRVSEPLLTVSRFAVAPLFVPVLVGLAFARTKMAHGEQMPLFVPTPEEMARTALELSRKRARKMPTVGWELTDHLCRRCWGRLLIRNGEDGLTDVRCSNCGAEAHGKEDALCCCGIEANGKHPFECVRNPEKSVSPAEIAVREREQKDGKDTAARKSNPVRFEW